MEHYLGIHVKKGLFRSPLRDDKHPTCSFYKNQKGELIFKDFSGFFAGNCISVVMHKYNCSYYKALRIIANDFDLISSPLLTKNKKLIEYSEETLEVSRSASIRVKVRKFDKDDLEYWSTYGINDVKILRKFGVYACSDVYLNNNHYIHGPYIYGYYRGKNTKGDELWRIYAPFRKNRFLSNWSKLMMQGYKQLPKSGDLVVVTKSMKDVMLLYTYGIPAIAPIGEYVFMTDNQYINLAKRFSNIVLFYDNDYAGIANMNSIRKKFKNLKCCWLPRSCGAKDISDYYKIYGNLQTSNLVEEWRKKLILKN